VSGIRFNPAGVFLDGKQFFIQMAAKNSKRMLPMTCRKAGVFRKNGPPFPLHSGGGA
jgi:hypothetical protein